MDVVIVGSGPAALRAARVLHRDHPHKSVAIVELGGRDDGAPGHSPAHANYGATGSDRSVRSGQRVVAADWHSVEARWRVTVERTAPDRTEPRELTAAWLFLLTDAPFTDARFTNARFSVDGAAVDPTEQPAHRGFMARDLPNAIFWTERGGARRGKDIGSVATRFSRVLARADATGVRSVHAHDPSAVAGTRGLVGRARGALGRLAPRPGPSLRYDDAASPRELPALLTGLGEEGVEHTVELTGGRSMCVRMDGPEDAPVVVLITGLGFDLTAWPLSLVHGLTAEGFRVMRVDNRDEGRSFRFPGPAPSARQLLSGNLPAEHYTVEDMAEDVVEALDALGIERADVIGFSLGGMIAQSVAAHHPRLVRRLISISSTTGDPSVGTAATSTAALLMLPGARTRRSYIRNRVVMSRHLAGPGYPMDRAYETQVAAAHWDRNLDPRHESAAMRRQIAAIRASGNRAEVLATIAAPTLVIHGDRDRIVRPDGGPATAHVIPGARFVRVEGMGHQLHPVLVPQLLAHITEHLTGPEPNPAS